MNIEKTKQLFGECLPFHYKLKQQRIKNLDNYNGVYSGKTQSKLFVPLTFSKVEAIAANIFMSFFRKGKPFLTEPITEEDISGSGAMQKLLEIQTSSPDFFLQWLMWVKYTLMHSLSFVKLWWHKENKPYMQKIKTAKGFRKEIKRDWAIEEPRFAVCDMDNLFFHPQAPYLFPERGDFIFDQYFKPISWVMKKMEEQKFNSTVSRESLIASYQELASDWTSNMHWDEYHPNPFSDDNTLPSDPLCHIVEYHRNEEWWVIANFTHQLHHEERPEYMARKPYLSMKDIYIPFSVQGKSEIEIGEAIQEYVNTVRNMRLDNLNLIINRMWIKDVLAGISNTKLVSVPGNIISARDINGLREVPMSDVTQSSYREESVGRSDMDEALGTYARWMGKAPEHRESASGTMQIINQANPKFNLKAKIIGIVGMKRLLEFFGDMNMEYLNTDQLIRQINKEGKPFWDTISPEEIPGRYNYKVTVVTDYASRDIKRQSFMNYYRYAMQRPTLNQDELDRIALEFFDFNQAEIDKIIKVRPDKMAEIRNPEDENVIMRHGGYVAVHPAENLNEHFESHKNYLNMNFNSLSAQAHEIFGNHILETGNAMNIKMKTMQESSPMTRTIPETGVQRNIGAAELLNQVKQ